MENQSTLTLLIYMAADNNLDASAVEDLESLRQGSYSSTIDVVVQLDRWEFVDSKETIRYHIKAGELTEIKRLKESNTGDALVLKDFIEESAKRYPSDKLVVVIWSHGSGVDDYNFYEGKRERYFVPKEEIEEIAIAFDDTAKDFLDNIELQKALSVSVKIDVLGFDACLMGMFELVYQLRHQADILVASQYLEPSQGWDYPRILEELNAQESSEQVAIQLVQFYGDYYERESYDVTQSALKTEVIEEVAKNVDAFAKVLLENIKSKNDLKYTLLSSQLFGRSDYVDLVDFVQKIQSRLALEVVEPYGTKLLDSLKTLIVANHTVGYRMREAHGVSIYFPSEKRPFKETFEMYEQLDFSKSYPHWTTLIRWYYS
jgi:hypothetical protein